MKAFSKISNNLEGQKMFQILATAKQFEKEGKNVIHFEIGDPDFNTPENIKEALFDAVKSNNTHYTVSQGLEEFREQASKNIFFSRGFLPNVDQVLVTPGANIQIYLTILVLTNPGDEVIITDPCFVSYSSIIKLCNLKETRITLHESNNFSINLDELKKKITNKTKLIILNSPNNPTGSILSKDEVTSIYNLAEQKDIYILSDEVYGRMVYDKGKFYSPSSIDHCEKRVIVAHSFSKSYAMTGWRIGGLMGPKEFIARATLVLETITSCVSPFIQIAAIEAMKGSQNEIDIMMHEFRSRRDLLVKGLNAIDGIYCVNPEGAFYAFPNISKLGLTSIEFSDFLLKHFYVATCPGTFFGKSSVNNVRFCYATSEKNIIEALDRIRNAVSLI